MKRVQAWVTMDDKVFTDRREAYRHADNRYGNALTALAQEAVRIEKYTPMCDFIAGNLSRFVELERLKEDRDNCLFDDDEG